MVVSLESIAKDDMKSNVANIVEFEHMKQQETTAPLNYLTVNGNESSSHLKRKLDLVMKIDAPVASNNLDVAAAKLQKVYNSYGTRRDLAECAVVAEELWWKALDFAALRRSSVSFFDSDKTETAVSRWARARTRAAKVGKGLLKDKKAQKLALRHWLEAIDPRHRYGHNLHLYYDIWFSSESSQPFFYWLDVGDGKEVNHEKCPRTDLQRQCIKYLGPKEREAYEVIVKNGKLVYKQKRVLLDTPESSKWIFVLSTSRKLYIGEKKKGLFHHSSFLSGGATLAAGRLFARNGVLEAIWPYSGHYNPTEENFMEFCSFLEEQHVDLTNVKKHPIDDDIPPKVGTDHKLKLDDTSINANKQQEEVENMKTTALKSMRKHQFLNWDSVYHANGLLVRPRFGCVRDYPVKLKFLALEQLNLSPRLKQHFTTCCKLLSDSFTKI